MVAVLLADEHRIVRQGTRALFEREGGFEVVGEAGDGQAAVRLAFSLCPDVVLMDVGIGGMAAAEATWTIKGQANPPHVIAFSQSNDSETMRKMFEAGASGYVTKDCDIARLSAAVVEVVQGRVWIDVYRPGEDYTQAGPARLAPQRALTARESEVLMLITTGMSTKQIAGTLHISPKTIESHRARVCRKLGITSVAGLTKYAIMRGLTTVGD